MTTDTTTPTSRRRPVTASSPASSNTGAAAPIVDQKTGASDGAEGASGTPSTSETSTAQSGQKLQSEGTSDGTPATGAGTDTSGSETTAPGDAAAAAPKLEVDEDVDARVLIAFNEHDVNDVITAPASVIARLEGTGRVDSHPDAVAYALSL